MSSLYEHAKETYAKIGIDTEEVLKSLPNCPYLYTAGRATMLSALRTQAVSAAE